jgi:hypothetical protein
MVKLLPKKDRLKLDMGKHIPLEKSVMAKKNLRFGYPLLN